MNPDKVIKKSGGKKTQKKSVKMSVGGKGVTKAFTGSTRPKAVYALRSSIEHDSAGVWYKVFMLYNGNTVMIVEFENGIIDSTSSHTYDSARTVWKHHINEVGMHRDDSCIEGMPLGDVKI